MDETAVKSTLAALIGRVEALETENARLTELNAECGATVRKLVARVENLQAVNAELSVQRKVAPSKPTRGSPRAHGPIERRLRSALHHAQ
jgi:hypothetical protein